MQNLFDAVDIALHIARKIQAKHGVTPEEVEEAVLDDTANHCRRVGNRYKVYGRTQAGRKLFVVLADAGQRVGRCISARPATTREGGRWYGRIP